MCSWCRPGRDLTQQSQASLIEHSLAVNEVARNPILIRRVLPVRTDHARERPQGAQVSLAHGGDHPLSGGADSCDNCHAHIVHRRVIDPRRSKPIWVSLFLAVSDRSVRLLRRLCDYERQRPDRASPGSSSSTGRVTIANRKLAENPHISTPVMLSTGPIIRHNMWRNRSPAPTVE